MRVIKVKILDVTDDTEQKIYNAIGRPNEELTERSYFQHVGFTSIPRANSVGIVLQDGENYTLIATTDTDSDRPTLSSSGDTALYSDSDKYIKIAATGEITIQNGAASGGKITLKTNGDIEIGSTSLLKLINENFQTLYNNHGHDYVVGAAPFITSAPTTTVIAAASPAPLLNTHMTTKVKCQ